MVKFKCVCGDCKSCPNPMSGPGNLCSSCLWSNHSRKLVSAEEYAKLEKVQVKRETKEAFNRMTRKKNA